MKILGLIPARGGSKGVPGKNIRLLRGRPLLAYTAEAALSAKLLTRLILSTEDSKIAEIGRQAGLEVPFMRPAELAEDNTPTLPLIQHAVRALEKEGDYFDAVCLLQPTNPLRRSADIDSCIKLLIETGADSVVSILPVPIEHNPKWVYWRTINNQMIPVLDGAEPVTRRQELPPAYHRDGSVYVTLTQILMEKNSLYGSDVRGYDMNPLHSINIDTEEDWQALEKKLSIPLADQ